MFNTTSTTDIYTLSLHDALPISSTRAMFREATGIEIVDGIGATEMLHIFISAAGAAVRDRKSTRLNSSHVRNSYAVFCLKKKNDDVDHRIYCVDADENGPPVTAV